MTRIWRLLLPVLAFVVLGSTWAFASPVGSSADENYHLASIWCAWGDSDTCARDMEGGTAAVPTKVATQPCFTNRSEQDARCTWLLLSPELVTTDRVNPPSGGYPPAFYATMRAFVGPDVDRSVLIMRVVNVLLAAAMLAWALLLAPRAIGRAAAMAWTVAIVPTGLFFIASVNPSSWAIIGGSLFWVFLVVLVREERWRSRSGLVALAGVLLTAAMAALSRSDSVWGLFLSVVAVGVLEWPRLRPRLHRVWITLAMAIPLAAIALYFRVGRYLSELSMSFPAGSAVNDQPNPLVKMLLELPAFIAGILGLQQPIWVQREDASNWGVDGWVMNAYSFGVGALDVVNPSVAGVLAVIAAAGTVMLGLSSCSRRKLVALMVVAGGIVAQMIVMRALAGFGNWENDQGVAWVLQPRYFLAPVMVAVALAMIVLPAGRPIFNRLQALLVSAAMAVAATVALMAVVARYMHGQKHSWVQFDPAAGWWWSWGPHPILLIVMGATAGMVYFASMAYLGVQYPVRKQKRQAN